MDSPISTRSLNIPRIESDPSYKCYIEHPQVEALNQIMIYYLGMEEVLKIYSITNAVFETKRSLGILSKRFSLPEVETFKELLKLYDTKYATVRSYYLKDSSYYNIFTQAAKEGNIQAVYNGLKMYPELRNKKTYNNTLRYAAINAHRAIINLLLELGATPGDKCGEIIWGASVGGHLDIIKKYCVKIGPSGKKGVFSGHNLALEVATKHGHLDIVEYLLKKRDYSLKIVKFAFSAAGESGKQEMIDYFINKGAKNYFNLVKGAARGGHLHIVEKYYDQALKKCQGNNMYNFNDIFVKASVYDRLNVVKFLIEKGGVTEEGLREGLSNATGEENQKIIDYLLSLGITMPSEEEADSDNSVSATESSSEPEEDSNSN